MIQNIFIDYENIKSIKKAETLENKGFILISTENKGLNKFNLIYKGVEI